MSGNDLLEYWEQDDFTRVIAMYLESFGNPRIFTELAKRIGRKKPILIVKSGRTQEGARAATSHTGALAGTDITVSTFLDHCGVIRAETIEELFDTARALDYCPLAEGNRVAIVTNAGGPGIMATDACVNLGLEIPSLSDKTREALKALLPPEASTINPVDMIASAREDHYEKAMELVLSDPQVDMALAIFVTPLLAKPVEVLESIGRGAKKAPTQPLLTVIMASEDFYEEVKNRSDLPPVYHFPESAARAIAMVYKYSAWQKRPHDEAIPQFDTDDEEVEKILHQNGEGYLEPERAFKILELYGIPTAGLRKTSDLESTLQAAQEIGYPVVLKAIAPDLIHKSDVGGGAP